MTWLYRTWLFYLSMCKAISGVKFQLPFWDGLWIVKAAWYFLAKHLDVLH